MMTFGLSLNTINAYRALINFVDSTVCSENSIYADQLGYDHIPKL